MASITINGHELLPQSQQLGGSHYCHDASTSDYVLIRFKDVVTSDQFSQLQSLNLHLLDYVARNTYTCRYEPSDLTPIRKLPYVESANVYHNDLVIDSHLETVLPSGLTTQSDTGDTAHQVIPEISQSVPQSLPGTSDDTPQHEPGPGAREIYWVRLHDPTRTHEAMRAIVSLANIDIDTILDEGDGLLQVSLAPAQVRSTAQIDNVAQIQRRYPWKLRSIEAREILWDKLPHVTKFKSVQVDQLDGANEAIIVADGGFDKGEGGVLGDPFKQLKIIGWKSYTTKEELGVTGDGGGHGTAMASCIFANFKTDGGEDFKGTAPAAALVVKRVIYTNGTSIIDGEGTKLTVTRLWSDFLDGQVTDVSTGNVTAMKVDPVPRVTNISYGIEPEVDVASGQQSYDNVAHIIDKLVCENQDWVFVMAAGNSGTMKNLKAQIGSECASKNTIVVGSTMNGYAVQYVGNIPKWVPDDEAVSPGTVPSRTEVSAWSSKGPTKEGRIRPDICAPGHFVSTVRSKFKADLEDRRIKGSNPPRYNYNVYGRHPWGGWYFSAGSSQAAAHISGVCALIRQAYFQATKAFPSAAMVKALLVNGAISMSPAAQPPSTLAWLGSMLSSGPKRVEPLTTNAGGWGLVNLQASLRTLDEKTFYDSCQMPPEVALSTDPAVRKEYMDDVDVQKRGIKHAQRLLVGGVVDVTENDLTFTVTLAYPDMPGENLKVELLLKVIWTSLDKKREQTWWGEITELPKTLGPSGTKNNVQKIMLTRVPKGTIDVGVTAYQVPSLSGVQQIQHYAVACDLYK